jgi:hypothetical protein
MARGEAGRQRPWLEVGKHLGMAALVITASRLIGEWIVRHVH